MYLYCIQKLPYQFIVISHRKRSPFKFLTCQFCHQSNSLSIFLIFFLKRKKTSSGHHNFAPRYKVVWLRGLKRHTANVLNRPGSGGSNPPASAKWLVSSVGQSTTLRTSVSGVRIFHESRNWRLGRVGLLHRS